MKATRLKRGASNRALKQVGTSHEGRYTYWQGTDLYIYQFDEREHQWKGWLCSLDAWERTFSKDREMRIV